jgi:hypothetical protein
MKSSMMKYNNIIVFLMFTLWRDKQKRRGIQTESVLLKCAREHPEVENSARELK